MHRIEVLTWNNLFIVTTLLDTKSDPLGTIT